MSLVSLPNLLVRDRELSLKARGLALMIASLNDGQPVRTSIPDLARLAAAGRDQIAAAVRELEVRGWLVREPLTDSGQRKAMSYRLVIR